jgi:multidrug efflux pump subunit AcrA (membrane-fusion protein)
MSNYLWIPAAACLLWAAGCARKEEKEAEPIAPVQVEAVRTAPVRRLVDADAVLYPINQSNISPKVSAPVQKFLVNRGDHVQAGQLLAVLENRDLVAAAAANKAQVDQAEANLRSTADATVPEAVVKAQTDVQSDQEQYDAAQKVLESRQKLLREGALARKLVDDAAVQFAQAKAQLETAREHLRTLQSVGKQAQIQGAQAQVETARAQYQSAQAQVGYTEVRSLISGTVADRPLYPGDIASAGTPMITIVDTSKVVARANVPQKEAAAIRVGDPATIKLTDGTAEVPGKVTVVSPATDPSSTTLQVWVQADNPGGRLKPGASAHATIVTAVIPDAVVAPAQAILPGEEGGSMVMTVSAGNIAHQKKVEVGVTDGDKVQILSGVSPGERVITVGGVGLDDNSKVRIVQPGEKDEEK